MFIILISSNPSSRVGGSNLAASFNTVSSPTERVLFLSLEMHTSIGALKTVAIFWRSRSEKYARVSFNIQERKANEQKQKVEIPYEAYLKDDENLEEKTKETEIYHIPYKSIGLESQNSKNTSYKSNDVEEKTL